MERRLIVIFSTLKENAKKLVTGNVITSLAFVELHTSVAVKNTCVTSIARSSGTVNRRFT